MIITKIITTKINSKTIKHFTELGYNVRCGDLITIPISHLNYGSHTKIDTECDICKSIKTIKYQDYLSNINTYNIYTCSAKCSVIKKEITNLHLYGVKNPSMLESVKELKKETNLQNLGVDNPSKSNTIKDKKKNTTIKNYGVDNPLKSLEIMLKVKKTNIDKYGGDTPLHNKEIKDKALNTILSKFGVENAMQNKEVFSKNKKSNFRTKPYILPSGKIINIQGYEDKALNILLKEYEENDIITNDTEIEKVIGKIWYLDEKNKKHRYFPDFFNIKENKIIEVKSTWTYKINLNKNKLKEKSCQDAGFKFDFMIFNKKGALLSFKD